MIAAYRVEDFLRSCAAAAREAARGKAASSWQVRLVWGAKEEASRDLGLATERDALSFLGTLEPANLRPESLDMPLELSIFAPTVVKVDAYQLTCIAKIGYLAFLKNPKTGQWNVKSLKLNTRSPLTFSPFAGLLMNRKAPDDK